MGIEIFCVPIAISFCYISSVYYLCVKFMKIFNTIFYILAAQVLVFSLFTGHADVYYIVSWGINLLDSVFEGELASYADNLKNLKIPTNYSFSTNFLTSVLLLPIYTFFHNELPFNSIVYCVYYKFIVAVVTIFSSVLVGKIALNLNFRIQEAKLAQIAYLCSFFVQPISLLFGQIDFIGNFFLIYGLYYLTMNRLSAATWMFSLSLCGKPFSAIIVIPIYCILFFRFKRKIISTSLILTLPAVLTNLFAYIFVNNYFIHGQEISKRFNFFGKLVSNNHYCIFIICSILCLIFLIRSKKICYDYVKIFTFPLLIFALFATQEIHHSWELYEATSIIILLLLLLRYNQSLCLFSYLFICFLQFFKYFTVGAVDSYYTRIFDICLFKSSFTIHFWNMLAYYFGLFNAYPFRLVFLITICLLVLVVNLRRTEITSCQSSSSLETCKKACVVCLIPLICYFTVVFNFLELK